MKAYIISKVALIPMSSPANSKIQFFETIDINGEKKEVIFFEQDGKLEDLISNYNILKEGDLYDTRSLKGKECLISSGQIVFK